MPSRARGTFTVRLQPLQIHDASEDETRGRLSIDKRFEGDLTAVSRGEMLTASTTEKSSAGYVAIERVEGTLHGRSGSFALQHSGTMNRGVPQLSVTVVPDSGTGDLAGLAGALAIIIEGGQHSYDFEYTLQAGN
jgi:hypothetical protein